jgi:hypothetical protein
MTRSSRYTPESPEVAAILDGIWKSGVKTYYRIDADGKHVDVRIRQELMAALGISSRIATGLLQQAELPCAPFICTRTAGKAKALTRNTTNSGDSVIDVEIEPEEELEADADIDLDGEDSFVTDELELATTSTQSKKDLAPAERATKPAIVHVRRYEIVRQGRYVGIYNKDSATQELFYTEAEALEYLDQLLQGREASYQSIPSRREHKQLDYND